MKVFYLMADCFFIRESSRYYIYIAYKRQLLKECAFQSPKTKSISSFVIINSDEDQAKERQDAEKDD